MARLLLGLKSATSQHVFLGLHFTKSKQTGHVWETFMKKRRKLGLPLGFSYHIPKPWSWCIAWSFFSLRQKKKPEKNRIWISTVCKTQTNLTSCNQSPSVNFAFIGTDILPLFSSFLSSYLVQFCLCKAPCFLALIVTIITPS